MAIEVVEGMLEPVELSGGKRKYARYNSVKILEAGGGPAHWVSWSRAAR